MINILKLIFVLGSGILMLASCHTKELPLISNHLVYHGSFILNKPCNDLPQPYVQEIPEGNFLFNCGGHHLILQTEQEVIAINQIEAYAPDLECQLIEPNLIKVQDYHYQIEVQPDFWECLAGEVEFRYRFTSSS